jgi:hypothetical protein
MALCPEETAEPMLPRTRRKEFAEWRGLPFLDNRNLQDDGDSMDFVHRLWQRKQPVIPVFPWSTDPPRSPRHWGINE